MSDMDVVEDILVSLREEITRLADIEELRALCAVPDSLLTAEKAKLVASAIDILACSIAARRIVWESND
jgi:hypothetical protein